MAHHPKLGQELLRHLFRELLLEQLRQGQKLVSLPPPMDARILHLLGWIRANPAADLRVELLARDAGLSPGRFRQLFKAAVGQSPKRYVQRLRLQLARALFHREPSLSVGEVATRVGIGDAHYLHAIYRRSFGETPRRDSRVGTPGAAGLADKGQASASGTRTS